MKKIFLFMFLIFFFIAGCSGSKLKVVLYSSTDDLTMYGKIPERRFYDSSLFTFPLENKWEYDVSAGFAQTPLTVIDSKLFIGTLQGELHAIDITTGKRIGYLKTFSPIQATPTYFKNLLIIGLESGKENLIAYKLDSGEDRWTRDLGGVVASPIIWDDKLIVGGLSGKLVCFDQYGAELWKIDFKSEIRSSPALSRGIVYCAATNGDIMAVKADDGIPIWKKNVSGAVYAGITVADSIVIVSSRDSLLYFLNTETGEIQKEINVQNKVMATPSYCNEVIYVPSLEGTVIAIDITTGLTRWKFIAESVINTTPFVTPNAVFVASLDKKIYALNPFNGSVLWEKKFEGRIKTNPLVWRNQLIVAVEDRIVYCFGNRQ